MYDQLGGGFHRYCVDERWVVPHFEKMLYDNAELLRNYVHAWQSFVRDRIFAADGARKLSAGWMRWLSDRERGGFYGSQDADITLDDDGDYFTWTRDEAAAVLSADELEVAGAYYDIGELGDMHHNPAKNVLHGNLTMDEVAAQTGRRRRMCGGCFRRRRKLLAARVERRTPFIDETLYTGWNAMGVTAYLEAARVLREEEPRRFALITLDRIMARRGMERLGCGMWCPMAAALERELRRMCRGRWMIMR